MLGCDLYTGEYGKLQAPLRDVIDLDIVASFCAAP